MSSGSRPGTGEKAELISSCLALRAIDRREALTLLGYAGAVMAGCSGKVEGAGAGGKVGGASAVPGAPARPSAPASSSAPASAGASTNPEANVGWARGGTRVLAAHYPDPFLNPLASSCSLTCREIIGPCYASSIERSDISEGYPGLPVRLMLLVVDANCAPVPGASVDVWHARNTGIYSGDDVGLDAKGAPWLAGLAEGDAGGPGPVLGAVDGGLPAACSRNDPDARSHRYFRGTQTTDAQGRVVFDTCYPGWYSGRAIHIHFIVRLAGQESVISQLYFEEALTADICAVHPDYAPRSQPDTTNSTDGAYSGPEHVLSTARQSDGTMLAWKTLVVANSFDAELCGSELTGGQPGAL